jgi:hypothetical protein
MNPIEVLSKGRKNARLPSMNQILDFSQISFEQVGGKCFQAIAAVIP